MLQESVYRPPQRRRQRVSVRRRRGSYQHPIERRAVVAAGMVEQNGWTQKQAAGLCCVNVAYVGLVQRLNDEDRLRLSRSEIKLSHLWKNYRRDLAERRAKRLAAYAEVQAQAEREAREAQVRAEREAQVRAEREEQGRAIDTVLGTVSFDRVVERIVAHFGPEPLLEELDILLQRNGRDLSQLILRACDRERVMRVFDAVTAPQAVAAE
jgi:hypothetical protein